MPWHSAACLSSRDGHLLRHGRGGIIPPSRGSIAGDSPARSASRARRLSTRARPSTLQSWLRPARCTGAHPALDCPLNGPLRHRPAFRWRLGRPGPRRTASAEGRGDRAGSARTQVQPEARLSATPSTGLSSRSTDNGRARRPLNGPSDPPVGFVLRLRRHRYHRPTSGDGRGGRDG